MKGPISISMILAFSDIGVAQICEAYTTAHYEAEAFSNQSGCRVKAEYFPFVGDGYLVSSSCGAIRSFSGRPGVTQNKSRAL